MTEIALLDAQLGDFLRFKTRVREIKGVKRGRSWAQVYFQLVQVQDGRIGGFKPRPKFKRTRADGKRLTTYLLNDLRQRGVTACRLGS